MPAAAVKPAVTIANDQTPKVRVAPKQVAVVRPPNGLLRVREAAARLGLSKSTLDKMRCDGRGPPFVKITGKIVGYDPADLDAYAQSRKRQSTSQP
jgi:predicted DNA-binding transcriptional regulator AlpA